jgi:hypothetical protein
VRARPTRTTAAPAPFVQSMSRRATGPRRSAPDWNRALPRRLHARVPQDVGHVERQQPWRTESRSSRQSSRGHFPYSTRRARRRRCRTPRRSPSNARTSGSCSNSSSWPSLRGARSAPIATRLRSTPHADALPSSGAPAIDRSASERPCSAALAPPRLVRPMRSRIWSAPKTTMVAHAAVSDVGQRIRIDADGRDRRLHRQSSMSS